MSENTENTFKRSPCPVANLLDIVGDKWTLLIIRDMIMGKKIYSEFQSSAEKIPTNILADRLKKLIYDGLIIKQAYQQKPLRYEYKLTEKGKDLQLVMRSMVKWSNKHISGVYSEEEIKAFIDQGNKEKN